MKLSGQGRGGLPGRSRRTLLLARLGAVREEEACTLTAGFWGFFSVRHGGGRHGRVCVRCKSTLGGHHLRAARSALSCLSSCCHRHPITVPPTAPPSPHLPPLRRS